MAVDLAGELPPFHPHMTAPHIEEILAGRSLAPDALDFFITIRNPLDMLWSYYKFFKPDIRSRYNFQQGWDSANLIDFERWVCEGRLGALPSWLRLGPAWISQNNLSPLTLEAFVLRRDGSSAVEHIFQLEEATRLLDWLSEKLQRSVSLRHENISIPLKKPLLGTQALDKIRNTFAMESEIYNL